MATTVGKPKSPLSKNKKPQTIAEYIKSEPKEVQGRLNEMVKCIRTAAPGAEEGLKWNMPAFSYKRILVAFKAYKHHIGFYPTPPAIKAFEKEIANYKHASGSVQFPLDKPLPTALIKKIVAFRVKESLEFDGKWRS